MITILNTLIATISLLFTIQTNPLPAIGGLNRTVNGIQYVVQINFTQVHSGSGNLDLFVVMTDETGRIVAPVQVAHSGLSTYVFNESGPVIIGTRVASLVYEPNGHSYLPFYCVPDSKTGVFRNGGSYLFNLDPTTHPPKAD